MRAQWLSYREGGNDDLSETAVAREVRLDIEAQQLVSHGEGGNFIDKC